MLGQTLGGKYKVVRLVGEGGMGAVYEGEQQLGTTKRKVAIKTLHPHLSRDPKIKARFEREVGTVAELEHPNTIQVYDFGTHEDGILYIVMEFLQGRSLATVLESEGAMAPDRVERILQQIGGSLEEAHGRGIVHRDLKPDNIVLVDRAGKKDFVKVLDFGIAKRSQETDTREQKLTQQGTVLGTPPYMSPEQFSGRPIDARSDIYSLGVMAYEMLTGKLPFAANTPWEWATQHMTQAPIPLESHAEGMRAPAEMRRAVLRALAKEPEARFQTVKDFVDAFATPSHAAHALGTVKAEGAAVAARQRTEIGAPLDIAAAFGAPGGAPQASSPVATGAGAAGRAHGPTEANMAMPMPAAIPQPPPRDDRRRGGRSALLVAAGVIGIASIGAIVFAMRGSSSEGKAVVFDPGTAAAPAASPQTSAVATVAPTDTAASVATGGSEVPPLSGVGHSLPPSTKPGVPHGAVSAGGTPPAPASKAPAAGGPSPTPPAAKYDGPECQTARRLKALGHPKEAESWATACTAKGGTP
jgi:serine/threonine-protein kinase